ncbi:MAG TPA: DUF2577 family protein [Ruminiclostridium sp.]
MSWDVELAKQFKQRDNKTPVGAVLGNVISVNPLKIAILGDKVILNNEQCYICSSVVNEYVRKADIKTNNTVISDSEITYKEILKIADKVLCLPAADGQIFFIIDKVVI